MRRMPIVLILLSIICLAPQSTGAEAGVATLTIRAHVCPHDYVHQEYVTLCKDKPLAQSYFKLFPDPSGRLNGRTDADGTVTFHAHPGTYTFAGPPGDFLDDQYRRCTPTDQPDEVLHGPLVLKNNDNVICDYFIVGGDRRAATQSPTPLPPGAGHIRYFHALVCDRDPGHFSMKQGPLPPAGCTMPGGITLTVTTGDDKLIGSCTTEDSGYCALHVLVGVVIVSEDLNGVPSDRAPRANPLMQNPGDDTPIIVNIPVNALPTIAPANSSITVQSHVCPPEYAHKAWAVDCRAAYPDYAQIVFLTGQLGESDNLAKTIDATGAVRFSQLVAEPYVLRFGLHPDTASTFVLCSNAATPDVVEIGGSYAPGWASTAVVLGPNENIVCNVYAIPAAS